jgi:Ca-activated chloride channel family protein
MITKRLSVNVIIPFVLLFVFVLPDAQAQDKNASPYFVILSGEGEEASLPLKSTDVNVEISGVIADVTVKQTYTNTGKSTIEAIYVFPASTRSAVYDMVMQVGDRTIVAKIEEKKKARDQYETAKKEGRTASLLEEENPNVFKMNVANIVAGATVEVEMSYTELLVPTDKIYEFVYPTVVGPRYVSRKEHESGTAESWSANPYLQEGKEAVSTLNLDVKLNTGIPIQNIRCLTHKNEIDYQDKTSALISMKEPKGGNRDFVMQYQLAGDEIETGVLLYDNPDGESFFLAMMQPPERIIPEDIPPREYVFIVDVSGSMSGFPLSVSKKLMENLLGEMRPTDLFNVVFFAGGSYIYSEKSLSATEENIFKAVEFLDDVRGGGGTELLCALQAAMNLNEQENYSRSFVILTDGYVTVEDETFNYIRNNLGEANFFAFGIGSGVNRFIIEGIAHVGYGEPFFALDKENAEAQAEKFQKYIAQPVLTGIRYNFQDFEAYDVLPEAVPDLFAERPIVISGKYRGNAEGLLKVTGTTGNSKITKSIVIKPGDSENKALKYLWAREKIRLLGDYASLDNYRWSSSDDKQQIIEEITQLGLQYSLLTKYTSFIAVDSEISNPGGKQTTINQPNPLPEGVTKLALTGSVSTQEREVDFSSMEAEVEAEEDAVFFIVEDMPEFPGGDAALHRFIAQTVQYPVLARENGIQGRVYVSFMVDADGSIKDVKVVRGVDPMLDAEAVRVVQSMPKWKPGKQRGKSVSIRYTIPINFSLNEFDPETGKPLVIPEIPKKNSIMQKRDSMVPKREMPKFHTVPDC